MGKKSDPLYRIIQQTTVVLLSHAFTTQVSFRHIFENLNYAITVPKDIFPCLWPSFALLALKSRPSSHTASAEMALCRVDCRFHDTSWPSGLNNLFCLSHNVLFHHKTNKYNKDLKVLLLIYSPWSEVVGCSWVYVSVFYLSLTGNANPVTNFTK